ncbi:uncharacterized protein Z518_04626 [Rhinocladiella mackenziei CBS 650.93]|uniref:VOC domain-containing protein n=1 Tax=Rhinocladiella mackenziei CBS 650.93 TaxID=1442369 RepID=A0A0D2JC27_9EURO|nr:uncharacterized protein Z518_04626 [Rhinocladiella mackenziei CBS 650.93]KIX06650.1 hypothetical protein Z518_04626 [Rhinocladiella mackenziei CBS 650.93]
MAPRSIVNFNHVAISVPDAKAAVEWYTGLFDFKEIVPLNEMRSDADRGVYGSEFKSMKLAILACGNGVGLEIFEFTDPKYNGPTERVNWNPDTYTRGGFFHICLTVADVEATMKEAVERGARVVGRNVTLVEDEKAVYLQDPWGNVVELLSCSCEQLFLKFGRTS